MYVCLVEDYEAKKWWRCRIDETGYKSHATMGDLMTDEPYSSGISFKPTEGGC